MSAARRKKKTRLPSDEPPLWAFDATVVRESGAVQALLEALLEKTYADVPPGAALCNSDDWRYRDVARSELADAVRQNAQDTASDVLSEQDFRQRAQQLEDVLFDRFFVDDVGRYAERLRALVYNLRTNGRRILQEYDIETICSLATEDLAIGCDLHRWRARRSDALLNDMRRRKSTEARASSAVATAEDANDDDDADDNQGIFRCPKCNGHNTSYVSMQTRSADEPMTNFVTCHKCEIRFRR